MKRCTHQCPLQLPAGPSHRPPSQPHSKPEGSSRVPPVHGDSAPGHLGGQVSEGKFDTGVHRALASHGAPSERWRNSDARHLCSPNPSTRNTFQVSGECASSIRHGLQRTVTVTFSGVFPLPTLTLPHLVKRPRDYLTLPRLHSGPGLLLPPSDGATPAWPPLSGLFGTCGDFFPEP